MERVLKKNQSRYGTAFTLVVVSAVVVWLMWGMDALAGPVKVAKKVKPGAVVNISIDGVQRSFEDEAYLINGSTLLPLRGFMEALGAEVTSGDSINFGNTRAIIVKYKGSHAELGLNSKKLVINGVHSGLVTSPRIINSRTYVPIRVVESIIGTKVEWDKKAMKVSVASSRATEKSSEVALASVNAAGDSALANSVSPSVKGGPIKTLDISNRVAVKNEKGIKVYYGSHDYGSKNQAEYDAVMEIIDREVAKYETVWGEEDRTAALDAYLAGDRYTNYPEMSDMFIKLFHVEQVVDRLVEHGVSRDKILQVWKLMFVVVNLKSTSVVKEGPPDSAYNALVNKATDCDAGAHVLMAVYDRMGYNTVMVARTKHAVALVEIDGMWYNLTGGEFSGGSDQGLAAALKSEGFYTHVQPTWGKFIIE